MLVCAPLWCAVRPVRLDVMVVGRSVRAAVLIENTNDNTANLDIEFEVLASGRVVSRASRSAAAPPLLSTQVEAELELQEVRTWQIDDPFRYEIRARMQKHPEAVEGGYEASFSRRFRIGSGSLDGVPRVAAAGVSFGAEHLHVLREAGIAVLVDAEPRAEVREWAEEHGLIVVGRVPDGFAVAERFVPDYCSADGRTNGNWVRIREKYSPAVLRTITEIDGVTRIEVEARQRLRGYTVVVGNQEQRLRDLAPGEWAELDFPSVNPYRVEVKTPGGFIVAER